MLYTHSPFKIESDVYEFYNKNYVVRDVVIYVDALRAKATGSKANVWRNKSLGIIHSIEKGNIALLMCSIEDLDSGKLASIPTKSSQYSEHSKDSCYLKKVPLSELLGHSSAIFGIEYTDECDNLVELLEKANYKYVKKKREFYLTDDNLDAITDVITEKDIQLAKLKNWEDSYKFI